MTRDEPERATVVDLRNALERDEPSEVMRLAEGVPPEELSR